MLHATPQSWTKTLNYIKLLNMRLKIIKGVLYSFKVNKYVKFINDLKNN